MQWVLCETRVVVGVNPVRWVLCETRAVVEVDPVRWGFPKDGPLLYETKVWYPWPVVVEIGPTQWSVPEVLLCEMRAVGRVDPMWWNVEVGVRSPYGTSQFD